MQANISTPGLADNISKLLGLIGQPARIQILMVIAGEDACVCHLEAALGMRQASISQHLTALRKGGLVEAIRSGRHIYYHLVSPETVGLLEGAALAAGVDPGQLRRLSSRPVAGCPCPQCNPGTESE